MYSVYNCLNCDGQKSNDLSRKINSDPNSISVCLSLTKMIILEDEGVKVVDDKWDKNNQLNGFWDKFSILCVKSIRWILRSTEQISMIDPSWQSIDTVLNDHRNIRLDKYITHSI